MSGPLLLLDGASLWFRAFYALPESMTAPDGRPVNAVRGFTDMVAALITRTQPSRLAVCLDLDWRPQFRVDAVPSYKAHRVAEGSDGSAEEVPDTLTPQVDMIMDVLDAAGIATAGAAGLEADDVLGTLAAQEKTDTVVVVSGDRDLLQVVADDPVAVRVLYVGRGLAKAELFGQEEVAAKYGVPPVRSPSRGSTSTRARAVWRLSRAPTRTTRRPSTPVTATSGPPSSARSICGACRCVSRIRRSATSSSDGRPPQPGRTVNSCGRRFIDSQPSAVTTTMSSMRAPQRPRK